MATKVICIAVAAVIIVALMFLTDKLLPHKDENDSDGKN